MRGRETCSQLRGKFWYGTCFQNREQVGSDERGREHVGEIKMGEIGGIRFLHVGRVCLRSAGQINPGEGRGWRDKD